MGRQDEEHRRQEPCGAGRLPEQFHCLSSGFGAGFGADRCNQCLLSDLGAISVRSRILECCFHVSFKQRTVTSSSGVTRALSVAWGLKFGLGEGEVAAVTPLPNTAGLNDRVTRRTPSPDLDEHGHQVLNAHASSLFPTV